jgi:hypothetical protein
MTDITVRKIRFPFGEAIDLDRSDDELGLVLPALGLSLTMPYLEPYLIRTMKVALKQIERPELIEDTRRFSQQESHHYRNHAVFNEELRAHFGSPVAGELAAIEAALEADYQRFSQDRSLRFNSAYAEGFEAMTCSMALAAMEHDVFQSVPGGELWSWHMAEEIEHRTVAFDVYHDLGGGYLYRIAVGTWAQFHYLGYVLRFARRMASALDRKLVLPYGPLQRTALRRYRGTWSPRYDPGRVAIPPGLDSLLARFSDQAREVALPRGA